MKFVWPASNPGEVADTSPAHHWTYWPPGEILASSAGVFEAGCSLVSQFVGSLPSLSVENMTQPRVSCLRSFMHDMAWAFCLARPSAGNNKAARMAMIAITTSNSINVKPPGLRPECSSLLLFVIVNTDDSGDLGYRVRTVDRCSSQALS